MRNLNPNFRGRYILNIMKRNGWAFIWIPALTLSAYFNKAEIQLIVLSLITGAKWITDGRKDGINISIGKRDDLWLHKRRW